MVRSNWVRGTSALALLAIASVASAALIRFQFNVNLPGINKQGVPTLALGGNGVIKGHIHTRKGIVHVLARGKVKNQSGRRFHTDDVAAVDPYIPNDVSFNGATYPIQLKRAHYSVQRDGDALFLGTLTTN